MRMIQADCEVEYDGRGHTNLARGIRVILIKDDGTVIIHRTTGVKPVNYMGSVIDFTEYDDTDNNAHIIIARSKKETLTLICHSMIVDLRLPSVNDDSDFDQNGTERQQQEWLSRNFSETFGDDCSFIMREFNTGDGSCDLLGIDDNGNAVLIEVKRKAVKKDVYQVIRYGDAVRRAFTDRKHSILDQMPGDYSLSIFAHPRLILASEKINKGVEVECNSHGVEFIPTGSQWRNDSVPAEIARKNVNNASIIRETSESSDKQSLFNDDDDDE